MTVMEGVKMGAQIATMCAVIFSAFVLWCSIKAFKLQRDTLHANLFNEISKRINELLDKEPYQDEKVELSHWYERLFNAFEYLAFFANSGSLSDEMKLYYKSFIGGYCERIKNECPELVESFKKGPP